MKRFGILGTFALALAMAIAPVATHADLLSTLVQLVPPLLLADQQPYAPGNGYIWQPGYWAWDPNGYYSWVPGEWVLPPQQGDVWTPGYWEFTGNGYMWEPGYWANQVGYYGGIDYGDGYYGNGYVGGRWNGNVYLYNTAVTRVPPTIRNVYVDRTVVVTRFVRTGYNGGKGVRVRPSAWQVSFAREHHRGMTPIQQRHEQAMLRAPRYRWTGTMHVAPAAAAPRVMRAPAPHHQSMAPAPHHQSMAPAPHHQSMAPAPHHQSAAPAPKHQAAPSQHATHGPGGHPHERSGRPNG